MLERWQAATGLNFIELCYLRGFPEFDALLDPNRPGGAKISARMKVALIEQELSYRRREADIANQGQAGRRAHLYRLLLQKAHRQTDEASRLAYVKAAAALPAGDLHGFNEWRRVYADLYQPLRAELDRAIEGARVVKVGNRRYPQGERKRISERQKQLEREVGPRFLGGTRADKEDCVRKWDAGRRKRAETYPS
jgi:hypothetical protein